MRACTYCSEFERLLLVFYLAVGRISKFSCTSHFSNWAKSSVKSFDPLTQVAHFNQCDVDGFKKLVLSDPANALMIRAPGGGLLNIKMFFRYTKYTVKMNALDIFIIKKAVVLENFVNKKIQKLIVSFVLFWGKVFIAYK